MSKSSVSTQHLRGGANAICFKENGTMCYLVIKICASKRAQACKQEHKHASKRMVPATQTVKQTSCLGGFREAIRFLFEWIQAQRVAATRGDEKALSTSPWAGTYIHWSVSSVSRKLWLALAFGLSQRHAAMKKYSQRPSKRYPLHTKCTSRRTCFFF